MTCGALVPAIARGTIAALTAAGGAADPEPAKQLGDRAPAPGRGLGNESGLTTVKWLATAAALAGFGVLVSCTPSTAELEVYAAFIAHDGHALCEAPDHVPWRDVLMVRSLTP